MHRWGRELKSTYKKGIIILNGGTITNCARGKGVNMNKYCTEKEEGKRADADDAEPVHEVQWIHSFSYLAFRQPNEGEIMSNTNRNSIRIITVGACVRENKFSYCVSVFL